MTEQGKIIIKLRNQEILLEDILEDILEQNEFLEHVPSFTLRIPQLIDFQVQKLINSFQESMVKYNYSGSYQPLYPIKVNPRIEVMTAIMESNSTYGLEAGTKSELILILTEIGDEQNFDRVIMCNGIKDADYIELVYHALNDGYNIIVSIESIEEAEIALERLPRDKLKLALRIKPYASVSGHWSNSTGRNSKFGLAIANLFAVEQLLTNEKAQSNVVAVHSHPGSQMTSSFVPYAEFLAKIYNQLYSKGFTSIKYINFGGGLAINYDGTLPDNMFDIYTDELIKTLEKTIDPKIPKPDIMSESGRAVTALSSLAVIETIDYRMLYPENGDAKETSLTEKAKDIISLINESTSLQEIENACADWFENKDHLQDLYVLHEYEKQTVIIRKTARRKFSMLSDSISSLMNSDIVSECFLPDFITIGNFSVFNSACDHVLIKQYFPMIPVENLHTQPETLVRLVDITCDSDGEISIFSPTIIEKGSKNLFTKDFYPLTSDTRVELRGFPVGSIEKLSESYIIIALIGAYQDIIEMDHNLLGDLPEVTLTLEDQNEWKVHWLESAQNIQELVKEVGYTIEHHENPFLKKKKYTSNIRKNNNSKSKE
jgi:arginine decarboxylase